MITNPLHNHNVKINRRLAHLMFCFPSRCALAPSKRHLFILWLLFFSLAGIFTIPSGQADEVKIGVLIPQTGPAGLFGPSSQNSAELAAADINAAGGINGDKITLVFADAGTAPAETMQTVQRLWRFDNVRAFVGMHDSAVRQALIGLFQGKIPYVYTPVYEGGECTYGVYITSETPHQQLRLSIPWLAENKGVKRWYLIGHDYSWPRETHAVAREYIAATGGQVVAEEYVPLTSSASFDSSLTRIKYEEADAVLITLVGGGSVSFNIAFNDLGLDEQAVRLAPLVEENTLLGIGDAPGLYAPMGYFANLNVDKAQAFLTRYSETFGADAAPLNTLGESVYEGLILLAALANKAGSLEVQDIENVAEGITYETPRGSQTLTHRHATQNIYLAEVVDSSFSVVRSFDQVPHGETCAQ